MQSANYLLTSGVGLDRVLRTIDGEVRPVASAPVKLHNKYRALDDLLYRYTGMAAEYLVLNCVVF
jgi:hypothetical protein